MSRKVIDDTPMVIMDDLEDILMEDLDDILEKEEKKQEKPAGAGKPQERSPEDQLSDSGVPSERNSGEKVPEKKNSGETDQNKRVQEGKPAEEGRILGMYDKPDEAEEIKDPGSPGPAKKKIWKILLIACAVLVFTAAAVAYGCGVYYYSDHFLPATAAAGVALDNLTAEEAQRKLAAEKAAEDSTLTLKTLDGQTVTMDTTAMEITRTYLGLPEALAAQRKWLFPFNRDQEKELQPEYEVTCKREAAEECLKTLAICDPEKMTAPSDAYVEKDKTEGWNVVPADDGNTIDLAVLADAVVKAVGEKKKELDIRECGAYLTAEVYENDPDLIRKAEIENKIEGLRFTVDMGASTTYTITSDDFRSLLAEGVENETDPEMILDSAKFDRFMDKLSRNYSTKSPSGYRYFKSVTGNKVIMQSSYGWEMDREATSELIGTMLTQAGKKIFADGETAETYPDHHVAAVWKQTAVSHGERDTGESWVEVNLTKQKMYCVINGEIRLESNVVSGTENIKDRRTPAGFFAVRFKARERDLVGYNPDGTESYRSHVHYWMPVYNNIGLHDATWRSSFGGNIYLWSGSHGCVNLPLKTAEKLFGYVEKGMPVIIYREN